MVSSEFLYLGFLGLLAGERLLELAISRRNAAWAFSQGAVEVGQAHYPPMAALHTAFLLACAGEVLGLHRPAPLWLSLPALIAALLAQGLRYWAILALGRRWNTRIIVLPGNPPETKGPYRWLRHPNYLAVGLEMAAIPLIHGAWLTALLFSAANLWMLAVRIPAEERALGTGYRSAFSQTPRFLPWSRR